jgi:hypothetical protein
MTSPVEPAGSSGWYAPPGLSAPTFPLSASQAYEQPPTPSSAATPLTYRERGDYSVPNLYPESGTTPTAPETYRAPVQPYQVLGGAAPIDVDQIPAPDDGPGQPTEVPFPDRAFAPAWGVRDDVPPATNRKHLLARLWPNALRGRGTTGAS